MPIRTPTSPLLVLDYPPEYTGLPFLTLIEYNNARMLTIVDMVTPTSVSAYVLDLWTIEGMREDLIPMVLDRLSKHWDKQYSKPASVVVSKLGLSGPLSKIYRIFPSAQITRVVGRMPSTTSTPTTKIVKRRRRRDIDAKLVARA